MAQRRPTSSLTIALDLDETLGHWGLASFAYNSFRDYTEGELPPLEPFLEHHLSKGGARPHLIQLLRQLRDWKLGGQLKEVVVFTSASNAEGWVTFLIRCMERFADTQGLFGRCFVREGSPEVDQSQEGVMNRTRTRKDLSRVCTDPEMVWLVDDKPQYAYNGRVLAVPEYVQHVPSEGLEEAIKQLLPHMRQRIATDFQVDRERYPAKGGDRSADEALLQVAGLLSGEITRLASRAP